MTMKKKIIICVAALLGLAAVDAVKTRLEIPRAKLTIKVLDEQGNPVDGADVRLGFFDAVGRKDVIEKGKTDSAGLFSAEGYSNSSVGSSINKENYYESGVPVPDFDYNKVDQTLNRWLPWDATYQSILRPIGKPVPLYARRFYRFPIPVVGEPCGFDLIVSDWVAPWGKGHVADFLIKVDDRRYAGWADFDITVSIGFSNPADGIMEAKMPEIGRNSVFRWERLAPENGYNSAFKTGASAKPEKGYFKTTSEYQPYFFRVRSVERDGKIVSALYGKISSGIVVDARKSETGVISFTYYLNPTPLDRNTEWDPKHDLLSGLSQEETPREP